MHIKVKEQYNTTQCCTSIFRSVRKMIPKLVNKREREKERERGQDCSCMKKERDLSMALGGHRNRSSFGSANGDRSSCDIANERVIVRMREWKRKKH